MLDRFSRLSSQFKGLFPGNEMDAFRAGRESFLENLRDKYRGQRGFIVGNGPSLRSEDLERLTGEVCLAANLIHLIFPLTAWRPSYVAVTDGLVHKRLSEMPAESLAERYLVDSENSRVPIPRDTVSFRRIERISLQYPRNRVGGAPFSADLLAGYFGGYSVTYFNLQLAHYLGLDPVILIGIDHKFSNSSRYIPRLVEVKADSDHFSDQYRSVGQKVNSAPLRMIERFYGHAKAAFEHSDRKIFNASRQSNLAVFERIPLEQVIGN